MLGSMPPCQSANWPSLSGVLHGAAHAVLVDPHVAVGHRDGVDVRVDERRVPGHRVGDAVDVVPAAGVEADEVLAERGADFHQLEARFDLLDEHVDLDRADRQAQVPFERREDVVPQRRLLGGLNLRQVEHDRRPGVSQRLVVVDDVERRDRRSTRRSSRRRRAGRGGRRGAGRAARKIFVVKSSCFCQSSMIGRPKKPCRPRVHLAGHLLGDLQEHRVAVDGQLEVALVVQRHRRRPGRARPRRRTSSRRRRTAARRRRCGCSFRPARLAWRPDRCPESTAAGGRRESRCRRTCRRGRPAP